MKMKSFLVDKWKKYTISIVQRRFGRSVSPQKLDAYLDHLIKTEITNPPAYWVNNYRHAVLSTDLLAAVNSIYDSDLIIGGAATTYIQHDKSDNPMREFILMLRKKRSNEKKLRDAFERGVDAAWDDYNRKQNNTKIVSNSLYGVLGYAKFIFYNVFLAEAITRMGRVIIATASVGFENFLCDNVCIACESELYEYVNNILQEYEEKYSHYDFSIFGVQINPEQAAERIFSKCKFQIKASTRRHVNAMINRVSDGARFMLFYKNNFMEFNRIPIIKAKIMKIISGIDELKLPKLSDIKDPEIQEEVKDLWKFYDMGVFYNNPIYDNVRKMSYETRKAVLYIDTDSNFISLFRWVHQIQHEFFEDKIDIDLREFIFICANIITIFLSDVVDRNLKMYAANCNIKPEWQQYLSMKNEYFFWRILFGDVKKRYIALQLIQEGKVLKDGEGLPEIKGYDFRKFSTKKNIREFYTNLCLEKILRPDHIDLVDIMRDIFGLRDKVEESMRNGESTYFKQANVSSPEHYADPLRISGIKGVMLWNALVPDQAIDLPAEVDLIPIKNLQTKRWRELFEMKWPAVYSRLESEIFNNRNPAIAKMTLNVIAKPRNNNVAMPEWMLDIIDTSKVSNATMKLIHPIVESLGVKIQRPTKEKEYMTNLIDL